MKYESIEHEIIDLVHVIETCKQAGDYFSANLLFVAALHIATRGGRKMCDLFPYVVIEEGDSVWGDGYYDLLNIDIFGVHTCIPMPMVAEAVASMCYRRARMIIPRREHNRQSDTSSMDTWSEPAYGWLRMGEEALPTWLSAHGLAEVENLRGIRVPQVSEGAEEPAYN